MEQIEVEAYNYQIKKQNSKIQFTIFTDQLNFNENGDFYKAYLLNEKHILPDQIIYLSCDDLNNIVDCNIRNS